MSKCSSYLDDLGYEQLAALCREREQGWMYNIVAGGETESLILALSSCGIRGFKLLVSEKHLEGQWLKEMLIASWLCYF